MKMLKPLTKKIDSPLAALCTMVLVFLLFFTPSLLHTQQLDGSCIGVDDLLDIEIDQLEEVKTCDLVSSYYFLPFLSDVTSPTEENPQEGLNYYYAMRLYLRDLERSGLDRIGPASWAHLYNVNSFLMLEKVESETRRKLYTMYASVQHWLRYRQSIDLEIDRGNASANTAKDFFGMSLEVLGQQTKLASLDQISCFILFDVPTKDVSSVIQSNKFKRCIGD